MPVLEAHGGAGPVRRDGAQFNDRLHGGARLRDPGAQGAAQLEGAEPQPALTPRPQVDGGHVRRTPRRVDPVQPFQRQGEPGAAPRCAEAPVAPPADDGEVVGVAEQVDPGPRPDGAPVRQLGVDLGVEGGEALSSRDLFRGEVERLLISLRRPATVAAPAPEITEQRPGLRLARPRRHDHTGLALRFAQPAVPGQQAGEPQADLVVVGPTLEVGAQVRDGTLGVVRPVLEDVRQLHEQRVGVRLLGQQQPVERQRRIDSACHR